MNNENSEIKDAEEINPLFDIIQNIQSKLNTPSEDHTQTTNFNQQTQYNNKDSSELNINNIFEMLKNVGTNDHKNNENNIAQNSNSQSESNPSNLNIDLSTIMKFQRFFSSMNKADPRKNLLTSLKPFLRETRQKNIDTYITLLGVINALDIFANKGSDY